MWKLYWKPCLLSLALLVAACADNSQRYLLPEISIDKKLGSAARTIEVGRLELPTYVQDSEINLQDEDGILRPARDGFWADDPDRAMTELLAAGLDQALTADVVAEPLPVVEFADMRVDVKVRRFVGIPGQDMQLFGQFFLTSPNGAPLQRIKRFEISVPIPSDSINDYALAQAQAIKILVTDIATSISKVGRSEL